jgi:hypothetical protein
MMQIGQDLPPEGLALFQAKRGAGKLLFPLGETNGLVMHKSGDKTARLSVANKSFPQTFFNGEMTYSENRRLPPKEFGNFFHRMTPCVQRLVFESH